MEPRTREHHQAQQQSYGTDIQQAPYSQYSMPMYVPYGYPMVYPHHLQQQQQAQQSHQQYIIPYDYMQQQQQQNSQRPQGMMMPVYCPPGDGSASGQYPLMPGQYPVYPQPVNGHAGQAHQSGSFPAHLASPPMGWVSSSPGQQRMFGGSQQPTGGYQVQLQGSRSGVSRGGGNGGGSGNGSGNGNGSKNMSGSPKVRGPPPPPAPLTNHYSNSPLKSGTIAASATAARALPQVRVTRSDASAPVSTPASPGRSSSSTPPASLSQHSVPSDSAAEPARAGGRRSGPGRLTCAFYLRTGSCAYGDKCKFTHPSDRAPHVELNTLGLPVRPGEEECSYYTKNMRCGFGSSCKFHHPEMAVGWLPVGMPLQGMVSTGPRSVTDPEGSQLSADAPKLPTAAFEEFAALSAICHTSAQQSDSLNRLGTVEGAATTTEEVDGLAQDLQNGLDLQSPGLYAVVPEFFPHGIHTTPKLTGTAARFNLRVKTSPSAPSNGINGVSMSRFPEPSSGAGMPGDEAQEVEAAKPYENTNGGSPVSPVVIDRVVSSAPESCHAGCECEA